MSRVAFGPSSIVIERAKRTDGTVWKSFREWKKERMAKINDRSFRFNMDEYIDRAHEGEIVFITRSGKVMAALVSIETLRMADEHEEVCLKNTGPSHPDEDDETEIV